MDIDLLGDILKLVEKPARYMGGELNMTEKTDGEAKFALCFPDVYEIIEGANGTWTQKSDGTLTFRANGDFSKFTEIKVDGNTISAARVRARVAQRHGAS